MYRPFTKQNLYFDKAFIESPGLSIQLFPTKELENVVINCHGLGGNKTHSILITNNIKYKNQDINAIFARKKAGKGTIEHEKQHNFNNINFNPSFFIDNDLIGCTGLLAESGILRTRAGD